MKPYFACFSLKNNLYCIDLRSSVSFAIHTLLILGVIPDSVLTEYKVKSTAKWDLQNPPFKIFKTPTHQN